MYMYISYNHEQFYDLVESRSLLYIYIRSKNSWNSRRQQYHRTLPWFNQLDKQTCSVGHPRLLFLRPDTTRPRGWCFTDTNSFVFIGDKADKPFDSTTDKNPTSHESRVTNHRAVRKLFHPVSFIYLYQSTRRWNKCCLCLGIEKKKRKKKYKKMPGNFRNFRVLKYRNSIIFYNFSSFTDAPRYFDLAIS